MGRERISEPERLRREITATVARMKREGCYDHYLSAECERETEQIGMLLSAAFELTDRDVDRIWQTVVPEEPLSEVETRAQVERVLRRLYGEDDDGLAGLAVRPR